MAQQQHPQQTRLEVPKDQSLAAQAASPIASLSTKADPYPHYIMSGLSAGAGAYAYQTKATNPRGAAMAGAFSLAYLFAGRLLVQGHNTLGYDVGTITSLALTATAWPMAQAANTAAYGSAMLAAGGISSVANLIKSYEMRTGKPKEVEEKAK